ncbi:MAG: prolipoprotein diacylglyceryl transferase [Gammaproteobacteria bacterium]|nr:prolipoprotein diacylglyceryl transferase [Gammaproteobacteria bacterium]
MIVLPEIDPVAFSLGPIDLPYFGPQALSVRWYGLMYLLGFFAAWALGNARAKKPGSGWDAEAVSDCLFYAFMGVIVGGRLGYVFFYQFPLFLQDPLYLFRIWEGGMSFHGGLLGVMAAFAWFGRKTGRSFFQVGDFFAPFVPVGLLTGRIGNFINAELYGRPTDPDAWWAMVFPSDPEHLPRHASQLYEAGLEGLLLFLILWFYSARPRPVGSVSGLFLIGYGLSRSLVEFAREPDAHIGLVDGISRGQMLSLPMVLVGIAFVIIAHRRTALGARK